MSARELFNDLRSCGYRLDVNGNKLRITPATIPSNLLAAVKANKPELLALLSEAHSRWGIRFPGGRALEIAAFPPMTRAEVLANYPEALDAAPCPSLAEAGAVRADLSAVVEAVADMEGWPGRQQEQFLTLVGCQPAFTLADDLRYFRQRLDALQAAMHTCDTNSMSDSVNQRG